MFSDSPHPAATVIPLTPSPTTIVPPDPPSTMLVPPDPSPTTIVPPPVIENTPPPPPPPPPTVTMFRLTVEPALIDCHGTMWKRDREMEMIDQNELTLAREWKCKTSTSALLFKGYEKSKTMLC